MPNHITNHVSFDAKTPNEKWAIVSSLVNRAGFFDFNRLIPMPKSLDIEASTTVEWFAEYILGGKGTSWMSGKSPTDFVSEYRKEHGDRHYNRMIFLAKKFINNIDKYGHGNWYEWCISNWDTKWNAYGQKMPFDECDYPHHTYRHHKPNKETGYEYKRVHETAYADRINRKRLRRYILSGKEFKFAFDTAWSHPEKIIRALSDKIPDLKFFIEYADEDIGSNCGEYNITNGVISCSNIAPNWNLMDDDDKRKWRKFAFNICHPNSDPKDWDMDENFNYVE